MGQLDEEVKAERESTRSTNKTPGPAEARPWELREVKETVRDQGAHRPAGSPATPRPVP